MDVQQEVAHGRTSPRFSGQAGTSHPHAPQLRYIAEDAADDSESGNISDSHRPEPVQPPNVSPPEITTIERFILRPRPDIAVDPSGYGSYDWEHAIDHIMNWVQLNGYYLTPVPLSICIHIANPNRLISGPVYGENFWDSFIHFIEQANIFIRSNECNKQLRLRFYDMNTWLTKNLFCIAHMYTSTATARTRLFSYCRHGTSVDFVPRDIDIITGGPGDPNGANPTPTRLTRLRVQTFNCIGGPDKCTHCRNGIRDSKPSVTFPWQFPWDYRTWVGERVPL